MHAIVVYDTDAKRNPKILRTCRKFLHHIQNSVFEGQLTASQLHKLRGEIADFLDHDYDRVIIYTFPPATQPHRIEIGIASPDTDNILWAARPVCTTGGSLQNTAIRGFSSRQRPAPLPSGSSSPYEGSELVPGVLTDPTHTRSYAGSELGAVRQLLFALRGLDQRIWLRKVEQAVPTRWRIWSGQLLVVSQGEGDSRGSGEEAGVVVGLAVVEVLEAEGVGWVECGG